MKHNLLIIQTFVKNYRQSFYASLYAESKLNNIQLKVLYSDPHGTEKEKNDSFDLPLEYGNKKKSWMLFSHFLFINSLKQIIWSDTIVIQQENKHLPTLLLIYFINLFCKKRKVLIFWGIGFPAYGDRRVIRNYLRNFLLQTPNHWLAYTSKTKLYLTQQGYDENLITVVNNSTDTIQLKEQLGKITDLDTRRFLTGLGIEKSAKVAIYCGGLYNEKRIDILLNSLKLINQDSTQLHLIIIGDGPDRQLVFDAQKSLKYVHYLGSQHAMIKAQCLKSSDLMLLPGTVGLNIVDAFTAGIPLITMESNSHSPEIAYLEHGINGLIAGSQNHLNSIDALSKKYAETILDLIQDDGYLNTLKSGALFSGKSLSCEQMAKNFLKGVLSTYINKKNLDLKQAA